MKNHGQEYIWVTRWREFQHYAPERDRAPAWIKNYTKQLDDDDYRRLTADQRGLLHDLRIAFSRSHGKLTTDTRQLCHRFGYRVLTRQLEALNHAGFIEFCSRETLENRLEKLYTSRARDRAHQEEEEVEVEKIKSQSQPKPVARPPAPPATNGLHNEPAPIAALISASLAGQASHEWQGEPEP